MQRWAAVPFLHAIQRLRSELLVGHTMRRAELQAEQCGRGAGQQQRKAHPDHDGRRAEDQRLEENAQRTEQQQDAAEDGLEKGRIDG